MVSHFHMDCVWFHMCLMVGMVGGAMGQRPAAAEADALQDIDILPPPAGDAVRRGHPAAATALRDALPSRQGANPIA